MPLPTSSVTPSQGPPTETKHTRDKTYQFKCLPLGLACAPWVFTKTLKPVAAQLRQLGVRLIIYIDDILILAESKELARDHAIGLVYLLENLGFKQSQVSTRADANCRVPRFLGQFAQTRAEPPQQEGKKDPNRHTGPAREQTSARPTNDTTYLMRNDGQNIFGVFSENDPL